MRSDLCKSQVVPFRRRVSPSLLPPPHCSQSGCCGAPCRAMKTRQRPKDGRATRQKEAAQFLDVLRWPPCQPWRLSGWWGCLWGPLEASSVWWCWEMVGQGILLKECRKFLDGKVKGKVNVFTKSTHWGRRGAHKILPSLWGWFHGIFEKHWHSFHSCSLLKRNVFVTLVVRRPAAVFVYYQKVKCFLKYVLYCLLNFLPETLAFFDKEKILISYLVLKYRFEIHLELGFMHGRR